MAGVGNKDVATYMESALEEFRGVVYFDTDHQSWYVYGQGLHVPLQESPLHEAECFIFFDESRCRGSDMALPDNALAMVTLEPRLLKDRFLQGCARMRKLRQGGQSIVLAGTSETLSGSDTMQDVLTRIIDNTVTKTKNGVAEWLERAMNHSRFPEPIDIDVSLRTMYANPVTEYKKHCRVLGRNNRAAWGSHEFK